MNEYSQRKWFPADIDSLTGMHEVDAVDNSAPTDPRADPSGLDQGISGLGRRAELSSLDPFGLETPPMEHGHRSGFDENPKRCYGRASFTETLRSLLRSADPASCVAESSASAQIKLGFPSSDWPIPPKLEFPQQAMSPKRHQSNTEV